MKVLLYTTTLSLKSGGPSRSVPMMAKGLSEVGVDVTLMTQYTDDMNIHALNDTTVRLFILKDGFQQKMIESYIVNEEFDLVQLQSLWSLDYHKLAKICRKHNIPYIITPRGMLEPWSLNQKKWKKRLAMQLYQKKDLNSASCVYATSIMEAQHIKEIGITSECSVIPNGIEIDNYPCRSSIECVKKQVLFLSRIHIKKGIELLINAWSDIISDYPQWKLQIVGNGEDSYIASLQNMVAQKGLKDSISIQPPVFGKAKIELYQSSSLFVLPTYSENFGMVIAEAMSCGVPVITTKNTPWEMLNGTANNSRMGWCIELNIEILKRTLLEAFNLPQETLYAMGQSCSKEVNRLFNYRFVANNIVELYRWILMGGEKPNCLYLQK